MTTLSIWLERVAGLCSLTGLPAFFRLRTTSGVVSFSCLHVQQRLRSRGPRRTVTVNATVPVPGWICRTLTLSPCRNNFLSVLVPMSITTSRTSRARRFCAGAARAGRLPEVWLQALDDRSYAVSQSDEHRGDACAAKASFSLTCSMSDSLKAARFSALCVEATGPWPIIDGFTLLIAIAWGPAVANISL